MADAMERLLRAIEQAMAELEMEFPDKAYDTLAAALESARAASAPKRPAPTPRRRK